ncbi:MAGUK p55 subfamily member 4 isoform X3 [Scyliorhinus canicula]|uniref:MAGUK p55 subfamily member 4 isoform X3 n=1 Tax=Scyliorhinus canicula TaxID=7830 RepID=UPI0018F38534|nr:MAGUK p55 subfamily member 4 isoform X3 [Scyliorhinus canicula]
MDVLHGLLNTRWLQSLLKVYESLHQYRRRKPPPVMPQASVLCREVTEMLRETSRSMDFRELQWLLGKPDFQALLSAHDSVAQKDYEPLLPPLPGYIPEDEEALRIVCLVKNKHPLGATIKRHEVTGSIVIARVIRGGLADRSGLLFAGDQLVEVNGMPVAGLEPEHIIQFLAKSEASVVFKLIPVSHRPTSSSQNMLYVRALVDYCPQYDPAIPCSEAGLTFRRGDILQIVDQNDAQWWQAKNITTLSRCAGLVPSNNLLKRKQRELWWSHSFSLHTCNKSTLLSPVEEEEDMAIAEKFVETDEETFESEDAEFNGYKQGLYIAGFRRSMRLCRRKSRSSQLVGSTRCPSSCYISTVSPYEEVMRYQRKPTDRHRLIILVGPSGVGVNELRRRLIESDPRLFQSPVPHTTRPPNSYEEDGQEYYFVSRETFEAMALSHRFLEYGEYKGHLYGTSREAVRFILDLGLSCVIDLEAQRIPEARTKELKPFIIFIKPPSIRRLQQTRAKSHIITEYYVNRSFKEEELQEMEDISEKMLDYFGHLFDCVIVNDELQDTQMQLLCVVKRAQAEPHWVPAAWLDSDMGD